jgi:hypothetical protein
MELQERREIHFKEGFYQARWFPGILAFNQESAAAVLSNSNCRKQKELLNIQKNQPVFKSTSFIYEKNFYRLPIRLRLFALNSRFAFIELAFS